MGPPQHVPNGAKVQDSATAASATRTGLGRHADEARQVDQACGGPGRCRPRRRLCLLKGCEQPFQPKHPQARYCSEACRQAARRWRAWRARRRYRATERGKACRRRQCCRYRERVRRRQEQPADRPAQPLQVTDPVPAGREGQRPADDSKKSSCCRPGCYTCFDLAPRSPLQRFCSSLCRRALRRVLEREARWRRGCHRRRIERRSG